MTIYIKFSDLSKEKQEEIKEAACKKLNMDYPSDDDLSEQIKDMLFHSEIRLDLQDFFKN